MDIIARDRENPLQIAVTEHETVEIEIQPVAASTSSIVPFIQIKGSASALEAIESACEADPTISSYHRLSTDSENANLNRDRNGTEQRPYRIEWADECGILGQLVAQGGTAVSARLDADGWHVQLRFPTREALSAAYDTWNTSQWDVDIDRIANYDEEPLDRHGLTDTQQHAMKRAIEKGYYEIPRQTTLEDLADDLDTSHQALSECLRRANRTLVTNIVYDPDDPDEREERPLDISHGQLPSRRSTRPVRDTQ